MRSAKSSGRIIGVFLFVQLVGLSVPFILSMPATSPAFLTNAAPIASKVHLAILIFLANGALTIAISIAASRWFADHAHAAWLIALSAIWFVMQSVDNAHILSMLSLSQQYASAAGSDIYPILGTAIRSTRRFIHYTELLVIDAWFFAFYAALYRFRLVPRALAAFGVLMSLVHAAGIPLPVLLGFRAVQMLGFSLLLSHVAVGGWLVAKGFGETGARAERREAGLLPA